MEFYLYDENNYFPEWLLKCKNLENLSDINLFTQKSNTLSVSTIENLYQKIISIYEKGEGFKKVSK